MKGFALNAQRQLIASDDPQAIEASMPALKTAIMGLSQELNSGELSVDEFDRKLASFNKWMEMWNTNENVLSMMRTASRAKDVANSLKWPPAEDA